MRILYFLQKCFGNAANRNTMDSDFNARAASERKKGSLRLRAAVGAPRLASTSANPKHTNLQCLDPAFSSTVQVANQVISISGSE